MAETVVVIATARWGRTARRESSRRPRTLYPRIVRRRLASRRLPRAWCGIGSAMTDPGMRTCWPTVRPTSRVDAVLARGSRPRALSGTMYEATTRDIVAPREYCASSKVTDVLPMTSRRAASSVPHPQLPRGGHHLATGKGELVEIVSGHVGRGETKEQPPYANARGDRVRPTAPPTISSLRHPGRSTNTPPSPGPSRGRGSRRGRGPREGAKRPCGATRRRIAELER